MEQRFVSLFSILKIQGLLNLQDKIFESEEEKTNKQKNNNKP